MLEGFLVASPSAGADSQGGSRQGPGSAPLPPRRDMQFVTVPQRQRGRKTRPPLYGELRSVQARWRESLFMLLSLRCIMQLPQLNKSLFVSRAVSNSGRARSPAWGWHKTQWVTPFIYSHFRSFSLN